MATVATIVTKPFDVMKTRLMNVKPGEYNSIAHCAEELEKNGIMEFYKIFFYEILN